VAVLKAQVGTLHAELIKAEAVGADHRANFAAERCRCDALIAEPLKATADMMAAKEATARLDGELAQLRARRWWRRLVG
jgi:predicted aminopeptidase